MSAIGDVGRAIGPHLHRPHLGLQPLLGFQDECFQEHGLFIGAGFLAALLADLLVTPSILKLSKAFGR